MVAAGASVPFRRKGTDEVSAEVAVADKIQRKAHKEVRERPLKDRLEMRNYEVRAKVEELKTRLHVPKATAGSSGSLSPTRRAHD